jgi:hypothetical protein
VSVVAQLVVPVGRHPLLHGRALHVGVRPVEQEVPRLRKRLEVVLDGAGLPGGPVEEFEAEARKRPKGTVTSLCCKYFVSRSWKDETHL